MVGTLGLAACGKAPSAVDAGTGDASTAAHAADANAADAGTGTVNAADAAGTVNAADAAGTMNAADAAGTVNAADASAHAADANAADANTADANATAKTEPVFLRGKVDLPGGIPLSVHLRLEVTTPAAGADAAAPSATGTVDIPLQHVRAMALSEVSLADDTLAFKLLPPGAPPTQAASFTAKREPSGDRYVGTLSQGGQSFPFSAERVRGPEDFTVRRPQTPAAPFPYTTETLEVKVADATLGCTFTRPSDPGKVPAVLLLTGSGAQDRDETIFEHKPFLVLADALTRGGLAVLRCDDRGVGASTGSLEKADLETFVADAKALLATLRKRPDVDAKKVGALGHSEGGMVVAYLARAKSIAFGITLSGPALTGRQILVRQNKDLILGQGGSEDEATRVAEAVDHYFAGVVDKAPADELRRRAEAVIDTSDAVEKAKGQATPPRDAQVEKTLALSQSPWFISFLAADPAQELARAAGVPVLALFGEKDTQVRAVDNAQALRGIADAKKELTVEVVADANHLFQKATTGAISEYADLEETMMPTVIERIVGWTREATALTRK
jgi:hypothetical protein